MEKEIKKIEEKENKIKKEVIKIRKSVTWKLIAIIGISAVILFFLCSMGLLNKNKEAKYYLIGILFGLIGMVVRSISMLDYIDHKMMIDKLTNYNIKYRWCEVSEQRKIIYWAYFFKYPILITSTIVAFISLTILTPLNIFSNQPISIMGISYVHFYNIVYRNR